MIAKIMMIVGGILTVIGFLGVAAVMLEPLFSTYNIIFKRKADYVKYESDEGRSLLKRRKLGLFGACFFLLIMGVGLFAGGWFVKYGPRGTDSLFSEAVESGTSIGDHELEGGNAFVDAQGNYVDEDGKKHVNFVVIHGMTVTYKNEFKGSAEEFVKFLERNNVGKLYVVDDFAASSAYRTVRDALEKKGRLEESSRESE